MTVATTTTTPLPRLEEEGNARSVLPFESVKETREWGGGAFSFIEDTTKVHSSAAAPSLSEAFPHQ